LRTLDIKIIAYGFNLRFQDSWKSQVVTDKPDEERAETGDPKFLYRHHVINLRMIENYELNGKPWTKFNFPSHFDNKLSHLVSVNYGQHNVHNFADYEKKIIDLRFGLCIALFIPCLTRYVIFSSRTEINS